LSASTDDVNLDKWQFALLKSHQLINRVGTNIDCCVFEFPFCSVAQGRNKLECLQKHWRTRDTNVSLFGRNLISGIAGLGESPMA